VLERTGHGARKTVCARRVLRIRRRKCGDLRQPGRVAHRLWVAIGIPFLNGRDGPPEVVEPLAVPRGDDRVRCREVGQGEEPGAIANVVDIRVCYTPQGSFPQSEKIIGIKIGEVGLRLCAGRGVYVSKGLDLVILPDVFAAV